MPERPSRPFQLKDMVARNVSVEPQDTLISKRSLNRLGFYEVPDYGLTPWPDRAMFEAIKSFQKQNRLKIDGIMYRDGPTIRHLNDALESIKPAIKNRSFQVSGSGSNSDTPTPGECDNLYWNIDIPVCRQIERSRGKRAAARCYHTATARYAHCLRGRPLDELPPLDSWI